MNFEPQKFFIGLIDFFSVLLPGAILTYLLEDELGMRFLGSRYLAFTSTERWIAFFIGSYLLGHFVFLAGSWLLDDHVYDRIRTATGEQPLKRLAEGKKPAWRSTRKLAGWLIKSSADRALIQAEIIKDHYLDPLNASSAINTFQWCRARLTLERPEAMATVQRFEADSKFFRSLLIILCILLVWEPIGRRHLVVWISSAFLLVLAFWRYVDQRAKATSQAYWYIITLESQRPDGYRQPPKDPPTRAGGVVYQRRAGEVEYLLVQAQHSPEQWVLPKGHIEPREDRKQTAVREVREETGVWARIRNKLQSVSYLENEEKTTVLFYLMEAVEQGVPSDCGREHVWLPLPDALARATHPESRDLLRMAEREIRQKAGAETISILDSLLPNTEKVRK